MDGKFGGSSASCFGQFQPVLARFVPVLAGFGLFALGFDRSDFSTQVTA